MSDIKSESPYPQSEGIQKGCIGRRRLLRAGLAATPVVLAVSGRSAMAAACPASMTLSTMNSLDPDVNGVCIESSHHPLSSITLGKSPVYWKPNPNGQTFQPPYRWPLAPFTDIKTSDGKKTFHWSTCNYLSCSTISSDAAGWMSGTIYKAIFIGDSETRSFSRILLDDSGSLKGHLCAAYLNALAMLPGTYAMTPDEVVFLASSRCLVPGGKQLLDSQMKD